MGSPAPRIVVVQLPLGVRFCHPRSGSYRHQRSTPPATGHLRGGSSRHQRSTPHAAGHPRPAVSNAAEFVVDLVRSDCTFYSVV